MQSENKTGKVGRARTGGRRGKRGTAEQLTRSLSGVGVGLHVAMKVARLRESQAADLAAVRFLTTVDPLVFGEGGGVCKGLAAVVTPVRPLPRVGAKVGCHRGALRETLVANWAAERLLSTVGPKMSSEVGGLSEGLATHVTPIRLLSTVRTHVGLERGGSSIAFSTHLADVIARLAWCSLWFGQRRMLNH